MGDVKTQVQGVKNDTEQLKRVEKPAFKLDDVQKHLNTTTELLEKYESKLAEYNNRIPTDVAIPVAQFEEETEWQKNLMQGEFFSTAFTQTFTFSDCTQVYRVATKVWNQQDI